MANTVGIVGSTQNAPQQAPTGAAVSTTAHHAAPVANTKSQFPQNLQSHDPHQTISPRIVVDPLAGAIIQFLNGEGQVQTQVPSAAVVAYLRAGLTSSGFSKPSETPHAEQKQENKSVLA